MSAEHSLIVIHGLLFLFIINGLIIDISSHRSTRQLLYPNSTLLQLNIGFGTPSPAAMINVNWAIQANFQLPWNRSQVPVDILETDNTYSGLSRRKRDAYENDARLYHFYKYVEGALNGFGHNGTTCVLSTLCQLGSEPLHVDDDEDLLHELASFVLNPKNDAEFTEYEEEIQPYVEAYVRGENQQDCSYHYHGCKMSLIDLFSKLYRE